MRGLGVLQGRLESVRILLSRKADVNACSDDGFTALHLVARYSDSDSTEIAKLLIQAGAKVDARTQLGHTPLTLAQLSQNTDLCAVLVQLMGEPEALAQRAFISEMLGAIVASASTSTTEPLSMNLKFIRRD